MSDVVLRMVAVADPATQRPAARAAAVDAARAMLGSAAPDDLTVTRVPGGPPRLERHRGGPTDGLPGVTISHCAGWGIGLAWRSGVDDQAVGREGTPGHDNDG